MEIRHDIDTILLFGVHGVFRNVEIIYFTILRKQCHCEAATVPVFLQVQLLPWQSCIFLGSQIATARPVIAVSAITGLASQ